MIILNRAKQVKGGAKWGVERGNWPYNKDIQET